MNHFDDLSCAFYVYFHHLTHEQIHATKSNTCPHSKIRWEHRIKYNVGEREINHFRGKRKRKCTRLDFFRSLCDWDFLDRSWPASSSSEYSSSLYRLFLCFLLRSFSNRLFSFNSRVSETSTFSLSTPSFLKWSSFSLSPFLCFSFLLSLSSLSLSFLAYKIGEKTS